MRSRIVGPVAVASLLASAWCASGWCASGARAGTADTITMQVLVTGYVDRGYTASGIYTHPGTCAVDPRVIPLGTYITIDGIGTCHAEDTGGAVIGYHVDVWVPTTAEAYAITGYRMATWSTPSQQVLGYHATNPTVIPTLPPSPRQPATSHPSPRQPATSRRLSPRRRSRRPRHRPPVRRRAHGGLHPALRHPDARRGDRILLSHRDRNSRFVW